MPNGANKEGAALQWTPQGGASPAGLTGGGTPKLLNRHTRFYPFQPGIK
jgi:hypothetical protein